mmetsp:Transcript_27166/g.74155  ORF Transcript_27166/g.74155 Transcript_27166/m.74155 type:complete len:342 (+) Transcript_27166:360-1385(+)
MTRAARNNVERRDGGKCDLSRGWGSIITSDTQSERTEAFSPALRWRRLDVRPGATPQLRLQFVSFGSGLCIGREQDLPAERHRQLRRDGIAHLAVARVDTTGEAVPVGEALNARILTNREHPVFVRVDDGPVVRLGPAHHRRHDVFPGEAPEASIRASIGARIIGDDRLARGGLLALRQVAPAAMQLIFGLRDEIDALLVVEVENERLVVVKLEALTALARIALEVAHWLHPLPRAIGARILDCAIGRRRLLLGRPILLVRPEVALFCLDRWQIPECIPKGKRRLQRGRHRGVGYIQQVRPHPSRHHRDGHWRQPVRRCRVLGQHLVTSGGVQDGARSVLW